MVLEAGVLVPPTAEVPLIEGEIVTAIRELASRGIGSKTIAREVGVARNTVRRYLRQAAVAGAQTRPAARRLTEAARTTARELYSGVAVCNAVVVRRLLAEQEQVTLSERTVQRAVADLRRAQRVAALATVPGRDAARRPAADRFWAAAGRDRWHPGPRVPLGRGPQLLTA